MVAEFLPVSRRRQASRNGGNRIMKGSARSLCGGNLHVPFFYRRSLTCRSKWRSFGSSGSPVGAIIPLLKRSLDLQTAESTVIHPKKATRSESNADDGTFISQEKQLKLWPAVRPPCFPARASPMEPSITDRPGADGRGHRRGGTDSYRALGILAEGGGAY